MWSKGVFGLLFLLLVDLPAFLIHQQLGEIKRTHSFYAAALPTSKEHVKISELSGIDIPNINSWNNGLKRNKSQDDDLFG